MRNDLTRSLSQLEVVNSRNADADRLHLDHEARIRTAETSITEMRPVMQHLGDLEARTRLLERFRWQVAGALLASNVVALAIEYLLTK